MKHKHIRCFLLVLAILFCCTISIAKAQQFNTKYFNQIPIMHEGRIMPMHSFAISMIEKITGSKENADPYFLKILFDPAAAENLKILKIKNRDVLNVLQLPADPEKTYSYKDVSQALIRKQDIVMGILKRDKASWRPAEQDVVDLNEAAVLLKDMLSALSLFLPISIDVSETEDPFLKTFEGQNLNYLSLLKYSNELELRTKNTIETQGADLKDFSPEAMAILQLSFALDNLNASGQASTIFKVLPQDSGEWKSPWQIVMQGQGNPEGSALFSMWQKLAQSYHDQNLQAWSKTSQAIVQETQSQAGAQIQSASFQAEQIYTWLGPYQISMILYALSVALMVIYYFCAAPILIKTALISFAGGIMLHGAGLVLRILILQRPPVSTLYESVLFVSIIIVAYMLWAFLKNKNAHLITMGAGIGIALHLVSFAKAGEGQSLMVLAAVLNSNFWLATHVTCITIGYAFCLICSLFAHLKLFQSAFNITNMPAIRFEQIHILSLWALLFCAVGTVLGGIWADQSWGRFWGWDPKENGALLIVLWLVWVIHGRVSMKLNDHYVTLGLAYLSVIVALSWFGVNLLNVGLHSYGFTQGLATALGSFIACQTALLAFLFYRTTRTQKI